MTTEIDHLVVVAASRNLGIQYVSERLGVSLELGGSHERMGTHNALLKLDNKTYLEVIAIDPEATAQRPRWFGLDELSDSTQPRLATWIARTDNIERDASAISPGLIEPMSRGEFNWLITIPPDGRLQLNGAAPTLIQWLSKAHPCDVLKERGCELLSLEIRHPNIDALVSSLQQVGLDNKLIRLESTDQPPTLRATIKTPSGVHQL